MSAASRRAVPVGELDRDRTPRIAEVVEVDPVGRSGPLGGMGVQLRLERGALTGRRRARPQRCCSPASRLEAEVDRLDRASLPDGVLQRLDLGGRCEAEFIALAAPAQVSHGQLARGGHAPIIATSWIPSSIAAHGMAAGGYLASA